MPRLTEETRLTRVAQTVEVMGLLMKYPDMTQKEACAQIGISTDTYRNWLHKGDETIEALRGFLTQTQREMLAEISAARLGIVQNLIKLALDPMIDAKDLVMIERRLDEISGELQRTHHAVPGIEEHANAFLKEGPSLTRQKSRLASVDVERTEDGVTLHFFEENDVIDITPSEDESDLALPAPS